MNNDFDYQPGSTQLSGTNTFNLPNGKSITIDGSDFSYEESGSDGSKIFIAFEVGGYQAKVIFLADGSQYGDIVFN